MNDRHSSGSCGWRRQNAQRIGAASHVELVSSNLHRQRGVEANGGESHRFRIGRLPKQLVRRHDVTFDGARTRTRPTDRHERRNANDCGTSRTRCGVVW